MTNDSPAAHTSSGSNPKAATTGEADLWVELEIDLYRNESCPIAGTAGTDVDGRIQVVGTRCHAAVFDERDDGGQTTLYEAEITDSCICPILCVPGFLPVTLSLENGSLLVQAYADSRDRLTDVIDAIRETESVWRLRRLTSPDGSHSVDFGRPENVPADVSLTDKQREAILMATEMGYYDTPRSVSLSDLASQVGVSTSAVSQRLNSVETKLIESFVGE